MTSDSKSSAKIDYATSTLTAIYKQDLLVTRRTFQMGLDHQTLVPSSKKLDGNSLSGDVIKSLVLYRGKIYLAKSSKGEEKVEMREL